MPFGVKIQRDSNVDRLRQQVDFNLQKAALDGDPNYFVVDNQEVIKFISFEDALKELVALKNS